MNQCELSTFDAWYAEYPRKEAKLAAERAYLKALKSGVTHERLMQGLTNFNAELERRPRERRFIPLPASWLNAGRYDDEYEPSKGSKVVLTGAQVLKWQRWINEGMPIPRDLIPILRENGISI